MIYNYSQIELAVFDTSSASRSNEILIALDSLHLYKKLGMQ